MNSSSNRAYTITSRLPVQLAKPNWAKDMSACLSCVFCQRSRSLFFDLSKLTTPWYNGAHAAMTQPGVMGLSSQYFEPSQWEWLMITISLLPFSTQASPFPPSTSPRSFPFPRRPFLPLSRPAPSPSPNLQPPPSLSRYIYPNKSACFQADPIQVDEQKWPSGV